MSQKSLYRLYGKPDLANAILIAGWTEDIANLGYRTIGFLNDYLNARDFCVIEPEHFFSMEGVSVKDDIAHFPDSRFFCCPEKNIVLFLSTIPTNEWHSFLNLVLDIAINHCDVRTIYTVGAMVSNIAHTLPRSLFSVFSSSEIKQDFMQYHLSETIDYESPPGQRPTINSYLLWTAKQRNIPGVNLWVPVPFYLVENDDIQAYRRVIAVLDKALSLDLDLSSLDQEIGRQKEMITHILSDHPELHGYIRKLESHLSLTEEESEHLVDIMDKHLKR